jgi:UDP-2,3-diacylglucosamine pyrophosphatase LpxH
VDHVAEHFPVEDLDPSGFEDYPHHLTVEEAQDLADAYCIENDTMRQVKTEFDLAHDEWMCFRQVHSLRHSQPTVVDPEQTIDEAVEHLSQRQKRQATERKAKRRHRREREEAARKWWGLEESLKEAAEQFQAEDYSPPRLQVTVSQTPDTAACGVGNFQDLHLGARPVNAEGFDVEAYRDSILRRIETTFQDAVRLRNLERIYLIGGGDLVHSDGKGKTASGTELDMACSTATALQHGIHLLVEAVDMARQVANEVIIVPVHGNHDRTNGVAAAMAAGQRYHSTNQVEMMGLSERQYATYGQHLMMMTHADIAKKRMRKMGEIMRSEARELYGRTEWSSVFTGHYHFKAMDTIDESGRTIYQTPSPVPLDSYHDREAYVGARKGVQLVLLDREDGGDRLIHA